MDLLDIIILAMISVEGALEAYKGFKNRTYVFASIYGTLGLSAFSLLAYYMFF